MKTKLEQLNSYIQELQLKKEDNKQENYYWIYTQLTIIRRVQ